MDLTLVLLVSALFFLIADVLSHRVFHCRGFNEVDGEGVMVVLYFCSLHLVLSKSLSASRGGVLEKLLGAGCMGATRVEKLVLQMMWRSG